MRPADPPLDRSKPCSGRTQLTTEERPEPPAYNVLKTWASDDWGLYGRGEELLSRALARNPRVGRVFHVQPPVDPAEMRQRFRDPRWEQDMEGQLRRFQGVEDGGVLLFTPAARRDQPEAALDRTVEFLERRQAFGRPLVTRRTPTSVRRSRTSTRMRSPGSSWSGPAPESSSTSSRRSTRAPCCSRSVPTRAWPRASRRWSWPTCHGR